MMPRCSCAGNACSCAIQATDGLSISGTGSASNPFVITLNNQYIQVAHTVAGALDLSGMPSGAMVEVLLSANVTSVVLPTGDGYRLDLALKQAVASRTITWPGNIEWPGGTAPVLSTTINYWDWFFIRKLSGTTWLGTTHGAAIR
jgi:hypothetical protein